MKLTTVKEIYKNREEYLNREVTVGGWVRFYYDTFHQPVEECRKAQ